jgi:phospholipase/lecithinase/hemolysin
MTRKKLSRAAFALVACCSTGVLGVSTARAADFSAEYVFGDSLSDRGNVAELENVLNFEAHGSFLGNFPDPPSNHDSFTNGPVAVQLLANSLGLNANPSLWLTGFKDPAGLFPGFVPGTNYAVGGATSALAAVGGPTGINLPEQVGAYSAFASDHADPNALYVVMIGGNDVRNAALKGTGASAVTDGVNTELAAISKLSEEGAKHFLVVNVPNVGIIPEFAEADPPNPTEAANATTFSQLYDQELATGLATLDPSLGAGATLTDFDLYDYNASILANAAAHGFTNTTDPCYSNTPGSAASNTGCSTANIDSFVYWDDIHPTAPVQKLWAEGFEAAVPEPSTWAMLLIGFSGFAFAGYRRSARARAAA